MNYNHKDIDQIRDAMINLNTKNYSKPPKSIDTTPKTPNAQPVNKPLDITERLRKLNKLNINNKK